jgi:hypothetical protein
MPVYRRVFLEDFYICCGLQRPGRRSACCSSCENKKSQDTARGTFPLV